MKKVLLKSLYVLIHIVFAGFCLVTIPIYLILYPFIGVAAGKFRRIKHVPWWWDFTDWIEYKLPPKEVKV